MGLWGASLMSFRATPAVALCSLLLQTTATQERFGSFYEDFGAHAYLWGVAELLRMFVISALVVIFNKNSSTQLVVAVVASVVALVLHAAYQPFVDRAAYWLQFCMLGSIVVVFYVGLIFKVSPCRMRRRSLPLLLAILPPVLRWYSYRCWCR